MPVGQTIKNGKVTFGDTSYNGVIIDNIYKDGTGILTDGKFGPDNAKQDKGKGWVGWSSDLTTSSFIDITFEFSGVRKFKDVTLTVNVDKKRSYAVFERSKIFFASTKDNLTNTLFLQYCPRNLADSNDPYSKNITLPLCENTARFIKLRLYFGGRWLLITEITFNSGILAQCPILFKIKANFILSIRVLTQFQHILTLLYKLWFNIGKQKSIQRPFIVCYMIISRFDGLKVVNVDSVELWLTKLPT